MAMTSSYRLPCGCIGPHLCPEGLELLAQAMECARQHDQPSFAMYRGQLQAHRRGIYGEGATIVVMDDEEP